MHRASRHWRPLAAAVPISVLIGAQASSQSQCESGVKRPRPVLYVVRHGEALHNVVPKELNFVRRRDPCLADPRLTPLGERQAAEARRTLAEKLREHGEAAPGVVVSSTLRRALQTAEAAALPLASAGCPLLSLDLACEIQFGDVWNEPLDPLDVACAWPQWRVELRRPWLRCGEPPLETADDMIRRVELLWERLAELDAPVVVLVAHGCVLSFLLKRLACASREAATEVDHDSLMGNCEVRRVHLPAPDGRVLTWREMLASLEEQGTPVGTPHVNFWHRYGRRASAIRNAEPGSAPWWSQREWRYSREDEAFDAEL